MRKSKLVLALLALAVVALAMPAISQAGSNTTEVDAKMKGKQEVPGPGGRRARASSRSS